MKRTPCTFFPARVLAGALLAALALTLPVQADGPSALKTIPAYPSVAGSPLIFGLGLWGLLPNATGEATAFAGCENFYGIFGFGEDFTNRPAWSGGAALVPGKPASPFRPRISALFSSDMAAWSFDDFAPQGEPQRKTTWRKTYPGWGVFGGLEMRLQWYSGFRMDLNAGYTSPYAGMAKAKRDFNTAFAAEEASPQGAGLDEPVSAFSNVQLSVGVSYDFGQLLWKKRA